PSSPGSPSPPSTTRSTCSHACWTTSRTCASPSRKRPSTYAETMSGSVESGRPTPTRTRMKSAPPSSRLIDFSPLWPASPPPLRPPQPPALSERVGHHEAHVVTRICVFAAGVSQPDDQPVDGRAAAAKSSPQELLLLAGGALGVGALGGLGALASLTRLLALA